MAKDLVRPTAVEAPTSSSELAPAAPGGAEDAHHNHYNNPTTDVDQPVIARTGKKVSEQVLRAEEFKQNDLISHLRSYLEENFMPSATEQLLGPLAKINPTSIEISIEKELQGIPKGNIINKVVDLDYNGDKLLEVSTQSAQRLWSALQSTNGTNVDPGKITPEARQAFGRVVQIHLLTPITTLQLLVSLGPHFDIERIFSTFIRQGPSICYRSHSVIGTGATLLFCMKYYYLSSEEPEGYLGQTSGVFHEKKKGIYICRGSSSVAVQFDDNGHEDRIPTFATPWRLLINSCHQQTPQPLSSLRNGMEAYVWGINQELTGVRRTLRNISSQISSISVPSDDFLFDSELRESVLFEDESYSNSRTYFWALQSLRIINDCIKSILTAWEMSNTPQTVRSICTNLGFGMEDPMASYLLAIERQMEQLKELIQENKTKQEEIIALRDGLFNASAVLEARTTVTQGENIRILTYISLLFLPASFSTSIFGMQSILPASTKIYVFAIVIVAVCGPTYLLIWFLSRKRGKEWMKKMKRKVWQIHVAERSENVQREWLDDMHKRGKKEKGDVEKGE